MNKKLSSYYFILVFFLLTFFVACKNDKRPPASDIAASPEQLVEKARDHIKELLEFAGNHEGDLGDSVFLSHAGPLETVYENNQFIALWSKEEEWTPLGDSLFQFISESKRFGLLPSHYHFNELDSIRRAFLRDTAKRAERMDAVLWSRADLMLSDAFMRVVRDVKLGRLPKDSVTLRKDSILSDTLYVNYLDSFYQTGALASIISSLEPGHKGYHLLKAAIPGFLDSADNRDLTFVPPMARDASAYWRALQTRLYEGGYFSHDSVAADSVDLAAAVKRFQKSKGLTADGKAGEGTLRALNFSDKEKFIRIAITMDRYKLLPEKMPARYVWVNLPSYFMQLRDNDTVKLVSKIICGRPRTRTPVLTSAISDMITYPQWTVPTSIIVKEILPGAKKDPGYFAKKGFSLIDSKGEEVDPYTVDWTKYNKGIPYKVVQGSGDDNALGILKFNFNNKYAVYLHDTNQRYLFGQAARSLSHGCVRVQEWQQLANMILRYDNADDRKFQEKQDSLTAWLGRKEKHSIPVKNRLPVYLRYFTCEGSDKGVIFYEDIYGEDKLLSEKYFANRGM